MVLFYCTLCSNFLSLIVRFPFILARSSVGCCGQSTQLLVLLGELLDFFKLTCFQDSSVCIRRVTFLLCSNGIWFAMRAVTCEVTKSITGITNCIFVGNLGFTSRRAFGGSKFGTGVFSSAASATTSATTTAVTRCITIAWFVSNLAHSSLSEGRLGRCLGDHAFGTMCHQLTAQCLEHLFETTSRSGCRAVSEILDYFVQSFSENRARVCGHIFLLHGVGNVAHLSISFEVLEQLVSRVEAMCLGIGG